MKKNTFFLVIHLLFPFFAYSQVEWFPIGAKWLYESGSSFSVGPRFSHAFIVERDTEVEGKTCRLIRGNNNSKEIVYEENGRVYYYFNGKFRKMYDFSVNKGDTVEIEFKMASKGDHNLDTTRIVPCRVEKVMTKLVNGVKLKEVHTSFDSVYSELPSEGFLSGRHIYIEKTGCEYPGLLGGEFIPHLSGLSQPASAFHTFRFYQDSDINYMVSNTHINKQNDNPSFSPNPAKDRLILSEEEEVQNKVSVFIYDAAGRVVLEREKVIPCELNIAHLISGIYYIRILNGTECIMSDKLIVR